MLLLVLHKLLVPPVPNAVALLLDDAAACTGGLRARASAAVPGEQALKGGTGGQRIAGTGRARVGGGVRERRGQTPVSARDPGYLARPEHCPLRAALWAGERAGDAQTRPRASLHGRRALASRAALPPLRVAARVRGQALARGARTAPRRLSRRGVGRARGRAGTRWDRLCARSITRQLGAAVAAGPPRTPLAPRRCPAHAGAPQPRGGPAGGL